MGSSVSGGRRVKWQDWGGSLVAWEGEGEAIHCGEGSVLAFRLEYGDKVGTAHGSNLIIGSSRVRGENCGYCWRYLRDKERRIGRLGPEKKRRFCVLY